MNVDRTIKMLLGLIALFLGIIAFRMNLDSAQAQDTAQGQDITPSKYDNLITWKFWVLVLHRWVMAIC